MIEKRTIRRIVRLIKAGKPVTEQIGDTGILHVDKLMPYICVYRRTHPDAYFSRLLKTQASYLVADGGEDISVLLLEIADAVSAKLNAFLILEMWPVRQDHQGIFTVFCPKGKAPATIAALKEGISELKGIYQDVSSKVLSTQTRHPEGLPPLLSTEELKLSGTLVIGIAVPTLYEKRDEEELYSIFYRKFYSKFSEIIKRAAFEFIRVQTGNPYHHYLMLGKTYLDKITRKADSDLAKISEGMSFLLRTTPVNSTSEWEKFQKKGFKKPPVFKYRLITLDPELKKRKLYDIPIEQVEDPTLAFILRDKRLEIEKQLTMLEERGTPNFRYIGESVYGDVAPDTLAAAMAILHKYPDGNAPGTYERVGCYEFAEKAQPVMDYYQEQFPKQKLSIEIRNDVAGIMVSKTRLLIGDQLSMDKNRTDALIQHEVSTHILTYCNGKNQPLKQMYAGFAGYDQLQEGLAVLAEFLVGGLTINRMRLLAARVLAVETMLKGAGFIETFNLLRIDHKFPPFQAYYITMRIYRGGGLTKDAVYLAGLINVLRYIREGGSLDTLYTGKFNSNHVDLIEELLHRQVLNPPKLPHFLQREEVLKRLEILKNGVSVTDLLNEEHFTV